MFYQYQQTEKPETLEVCGIPFSVSRNERGVVRKIDRETLAFPAACEALFFLGMATDSDYCSEWWAQNEAMYDHSIRLFLGDRLMRIRVIFEDQTEDLISVIFGVNAWNYNLYYRPKEEEQLMAFDAPYQEPFVSDPNAKALKDAAMKLMENTSESAEKCTKWVFGYRVRSDKKIKEIMLLREDSKRANVAVSAVTGLLAGGEIRPEWTLVDQDFFLSRAYYADIDRLARRLYQFRDELPASDAKKEIEGFDAPDVTFAGTPMAEVYTNVYRANIMDMAYGKIDDDGRSHTSTPYTCNFGCYLGFGTFKENSDSYGGHVWTRDIGRTLMELTNFGYFKRVVPAADYLHKLLYYPSVRFPIPHWKRVANLIAKDENDLFNEGKENDGHASVMLFIYSLYRKGVVDRQWLLEHRKELKDAADYYLWQKEHPKESNFSDILFSESEASTQITGGYDLFSNLISSFALLGYADLFREMGDAEYASALSDMAESLREAAGRHFLMEHPRYGKVYTDTTDDCWTYEYKRMVDLLIYSDVFGYDMSYEHPEWFDLLNRTFLAQKEVFYAPESGRQMGYGQGYLTQSVIMLDRYEEMTECIETAAMFCYHHTDHNYIVPEGVIVHGSKRFWYRNSDLGNAVQQAEIVKCARLLLGIDDISPARGLHLVPRLPDGWTSLEADAYPVTKSDHTVVPFAFSYRRGMGDGKITASDGECCYTADWSGDAAVDWIRMGPFNKPDLQITGGVKESVRKIQNRYFVYVKGSQS